MTRAVITANAKINLTLDICGRRPDGYHKVSMIMQSVSLADKVTVSLTGRGGIDIFCDNPLLPSGAENLAYKAAARFFETTGIKNTGVTIVINKQIPSQAGLAGGSADAAAVIGGLDRLLETRLDKSALSAIGLKVGADLPFCLIGGTMLSQGIGERLSSLPPLPDCHIVIAKPQQGISTAAAYAAYDKLGARKRPDNKKAALALARASLAQLASGLCNVLEEVANLRPIADIELAMTHDGALGACMSGSGSAVFGLFDEAEKAKVCYNRLKKQYGETYLCRPVGCGLAIQIFDD